ncbi:hypothetical protein GNI_207100 [Gregarina niphandrodes]|nr:hypothetical protein GNI_207100 [Gregarina niphandrodes]EZG42924.1 hypothetical protein GNI_207100 [Gregarina niphandrodes]|eukprot:XP_011133800.1 hypothetical protein GNI_207100 [Gregarina niphandrodes]
MTAKFLKTVELAPEWRYYVKDVLEYAVTAVGDEEMAIAKVQCMDSYEHCVNVANSVDLWTRLYQCRSNAVTTLIAEGKLSTESVKLLMEFKTRADAAIKPAP